MLGEARKGLLVPSIEKFCVGVRDSRREPKVLYGCKCDTPKPEGPVDHRQPAETYVSYIIRPMLE